MNGADAVVIQRRGSLRLTLEALPSASIMGGLIGKELQCDKAMKMNVFRFVDDAHTSGANAIQDEIVAKGAADERIFENGMARHGEASLSPHPYKAS